MLLTHERIQTRMIFIMNSYVNIRTIIDLPITLGDMKLIKQKEKEGFSNFLARWRARLPIWWTNPKRLIE